MSAKIEYEKVPVFFLLWSLLAISCVTEASGQAAVTTQRYDNARSGANLSEKILDRLNVSSGSFGKLFTRVVDDEIYAQPLYVPRVNVPGSGIHNVVYVATVNNSVYAFDADDPAAATPLWHINLTPNAPAVRPVRAEDVGHRCGTYRDFTYNIGIVGTPVIDTSTNTLYVVSRTRKHSSVTSAIVRILYDAELKSEALRQRLTVLIGETSRPLLYVATGILNVAARASEDIAQAIVRGQFTQQLHAVDIATGAERPNSPVVIEATTAGTGRGSRFGHLAFDPAVQNQRSALLLESGVVYIAWASHCDTGPYHGWIMGYDAKTLVQLLAKVVTPNGEEGGIWQSGTGPSADDLGNIYFSTSEGSVTAPNGGQDFATALLKLDRSGEVLDWFIPGNFEALNFNIDFGSAGVVLIPETNLLASGSKDGTLYLLNRDDLGHSKTPPKKSVRAAPGGLYGAPTYWKGPSGSYIYTWGAWDCGKAFALRDGLLSTDPSSQTKAIAEGMPGGILSISANGNMEGTGILWAAMGISDANNETVPGVLRAFDATDLSRELWNSEQNAERDRVGLFAKFNTPVVSNGRVYLATFSRQLAVYGLLTDRGK